MSGIWQKRFNKRVNKYILDFTSSTDDDERLVPYDVTVSLAHVKMLRRQNLLSNSDAIKLEKGLRRIISEFKKSVFKLNPEFEDVHTNIEMRLKQIVGKAADKLHTARSRNDLVATDVKLYTRDMIVTTMGCLVDLQKSIIKNALSNFGAIIPGYTHLQQAQPLLWPYYLLSHFFRFQRDLECLKDVLKRVNISPLGSCAFAGTSHEIDPDYTASLLNFARYTENGLDAVTERDYLGESLFYFSQIALHIAAFAEDIIIYSTKEFDLIELDDSITTGSSIMPHKKNPDVCELLRAKTGSAIGSLVSLLTILKGLPSSYNRDLQETKKIFFNQANETIQCLKIMRVVVDSISLKKSDWADRENSICAVDLVDYMVKNGYAFRQAYNIITDCVRESKGKVYWFIEMCAERMKLRRDIISGIIKPRNSIATRVSKNSTGIKQTEDAISRAREMVVNNEQNLIHIRKTNSEIAAV